MGRRKTRRFDKKNSVTFRLVSRSHGPGSHEGQPRRVLVPKGVAQSQEQANLEDKVMRMTGSLPEHQAGFGRGPRGEDDDDEDDDGAYGEYEEEEYEEGQDDEGEEEEEDEDERLHFFSTRDGEAELGLPDDGYDYSQHMRPLTGDGVYLQPKEGGGFQIGAEPKKIEFEPSEMFKSQQYDLSFRDAPQARPVPVERVDEDVRRALELADDEVDGEEYVTEIAPDDATSGADGDSGSRDDTDNYEELEDDFVLKASGLEEFYGPNAHPPEDYDFEDEAHSDLPPDLLAAMRRDIGGSDDDSDDEMPGLESSALRGGDNNERALDPAEVHFRALLDEHFEATAARYADEDIGELDPEEIERLSKVQLPPGDHMRRVFDDYVKNRYQDRSLEVLSTETKDYVMRYADQLAERWSKMPDEEEEGEVDAAEVRRHAERHTHKWDVETILSTYTNTENHPTLLDDPHNDKNKSKKSRRKFLVEDDVEETEKIQISAKGLPLGVLNDKPSRRRDAANDDSDNIEKDTSDGFVKLEFNDDGFGDDDDGEPRNKGAKRRGETAEEKRRRKAAVKAERRERRKQKKTNRVAFHKEEMRQSKLQAPTSITPLN